MRKFVSISAVSSTAGVSHGSITYETLYGLADDGTVWEYRSRIGAPNDRPPEWRQLPSLPAPEKKSISEAEKAVRPKQAQMD